MKLLITAGGGGHFSPALALIESLSEDTKVEIIGRKYVFEGDSSESLESKTAREKNIPFHAIESGRFQRKLTKHSLLAFMKTLKAFFRSYGLLKKIQPDVIMSFGGYTTVPVCLAGWLLHIPIVIHEQTLDAGLANKVVGYFSSVICISFKESEKYFPKKKVVLTGNLIRQDILKAREKKKEKNTPPQMYITGGSGGSHALNVLIEGCIEKLLADFSVIHQVGSSMEFKDYERLEDKKEKMEPTLKKRYTVIKHVPHKEVGEIMYKADMIISRSGINTVSELLYLGTPCILIPLPHGQKNEQLKNAEFVSSLGLGEILRQEHTTSENLYKKVKEFFATIERYEENEEKARSVIPVGAASQVRKILLHVSEQKNQSKNSSS